MSQDEVNEWRRKKNHVQEKFSKGQPIFFFIEIRGCYYIAFPQSRLLRKRTDGAMLDCKRIVQGQTGSNRTAEITSKGVRMIYAEKERKDLMEQWLHLNGETTKRPW